MRPDGHKTQKASKLLENSSNYRDSSSSKRSHVWLCVCLYMFILGPIGWQKMLYVRVVREGRWKFTNLFDIRNTLGKLELVKVRKVFCVVVCLAGL